METRRNPSSSRVSLQKKKCFTGNRDPVAPDSHGAGADGYFEGDPPSGHPDSPILG